VLREVLFRLWGDLEEQKSAYLKERKEKASKTNGKPPESHATATNPKASHAKPGDDLPPDSDDESTPKGKGAKSSSIIDIGGSPLDMGETDTDLSVAISSLPITNKGFTCCIQQYGIKVPEESYSKADAEDGFRWKRVFGLFGTAIT
jgi:protection-of-telomeres protein 1